MASASKEQTAHDRLVTPPPSPIIQHPTLILSGLPVLSLSQHSPRLPVTNGSAASVEITQLTYDGPFSSQKAGGNSGETGSGPGSIDEIAKISPSTSQPNVTISKAAENKSTERVGEALPMRFSRSGRLVRQRQPNIPPSFTVDDQDDSSDEYRADDDDQESERDLSKERSPRKLRRTPLRRLGIRRIPKHLRATRIEVHRLLDYFLLNTDWNMAARFVICGPGASRLPVSSNLADPRIPSQQAVVDASGRLRAHWKEILIRRVLELYRK